MSFQYGSLQPIRGSAGTDTPSFTFPAFIKATSSEAYSTTVIPGLHPAQSPTVSTVTSSADGKQSNSSAAMARKPNTKENDDGPAATLSPAGISNSNAAPATSAQDDEPVPPPLPPRNPARSTPTVEGPSESDRAMLFFLMFCAFLGAACLALALMAGAFGIMRRLFGGGDTFYYTVTRLAPVWTTTVVARSL